MKSIKFLNSILPHILWMEILPYVDLALVDELINNFDVPAECTPFLLHMSQATRQGHLCIHISDNQIFPKPEETWEINENATLLTIDWEKINEFIFAGVEKLPQNLITKIENEKISSTPLCQYKNLFYFQKYWSFENSCFIEFNRLLQNQPSLILNSTLIQKRLSELLEDKKVQTEQAEAIAQLPNQTLTLIAGGPGTGKTYTAGLLIKIFWEALSHEQRKNCRICLAAPTGKAAANLQTSLSKVVGDLSDFPTIQATTLHSLLGLKPNQSIPASINADLLVIDECSMIDSRMMSLLLRALKPGLRLIMLGDPHQLPPIEAGSFFYTMTQLCKSPHLIKLHKCLRVELEEMVSLANHIKEGACQAALHLLNSPSNNLFFHSIPVDSSPTKIQQELWDKTASYYLINSEKNEDLNRFRLLSPLRKGPLGVDQLNAFFYQQMLKKTAHQTNLIVPIMISSNDSKKNLFNGDVGILVRQRNFAEEALQMGDYAIISGKKIPALLLPRFEYAFCLSVHKSQGSEFNHILLLLPDGSYRFGREMIYTAVTRARHKLEVWGQISQFEKVLKNSAKRLSKLELIEQIQI